MPRCKHATARRAPKPAPAKTWAQLQQEALYRSMLNQQQNNFGYGLLNSAAGASLGFLHLNDQQIGLGMRQPMLNPSAWAEKAELDEGAGWPNVQTSGNEATQLGIWRERARQFAMRLAKCGKKVSQLFRGVGA